MIVISPALSESPHICRRALSIWRDMIVAIRVKLNNLDSFSTHHIWFDGEDWKESVWRCRSKKSHLQAPDRDIHNNCDAIVGIIIDMKDVRLSCSDKFDDLKEKMHDDMKGHLQLTSSITQPVCSRC